MITFWRQELAGEEAQSSPAELTAMKPGFHGLFDREPYGQISAAWRPYHLAQNRVWAGGSRWHGIAIPLIQPTLLALGLAAYLQGYARGIGKSDPTRCFSCGYPIPATKAGSPQSTCPECGADPQRGRPEIKLAPSGASASTSV